MFHSDYDEELQSVASDKPHMYMRSRSSVSNSSFQDSILNILLLQNTLDNTRTKRHLLRSRGKTFENVETKMKTIENSLSNTALSGLRKIPPDKTDMHETVQKLRRDIEAKETYISQ